MIHGTVVLMESNAWGVMLRTMLLVTGTERLVLRAVLLASCDAGNFELGDRCGNGYRDCDVGEERILSTGAEDYIGENFFFLGSFHL